MITLRPSSACRDSWSQLCLPCCCQINYPALTCSFSSRAHLSAVGNTQRSFVTQVAVLPRHPSELAVTESDGDSGLLQKATEGLTGGESPVQGEGKLIGDTLAANGEWEVRGCA